MYSNMLLLMLLVDVCPALSAPGHGTLSTDTAVYGTIVTIACDLGFWYPDERLSLSLECLDGGIWSGSTNISNCQGNHCK